MSKRPLEDEESNQGPEKKRQRATATNSNPPNETLDNSVESICTISTTLAQYREVKDSPSLSQVMATISLFSADTPQLFKTLSRFRKTSEYTDITITFNKGTKTFKAHRVILAASSPVFESMLKGWREGSSTDITLEEDCDANTFTMFIKYLYGGPITLTGGNVYFLLMLANKYDVSQLTKQCCNIILATLDSNNAQLALQFSEALSLDHFHLKLLSKIALDLQELMDNNLFEQLEARFIIKLLQRNDLWVKSEEDIFLKLMEVKAQDLCTVLPFIRFAQMQTPFLERTAEKLLPQQLHHLILDAYRFRAFSEKERSILFNKSSFLPRMYTSENYRWVITKSKLDSVKDSEALESPYFMIDNHTLSLWVYPSGYSAVSEWKDQVLVCISSKEQCCLDLKGTINIYSQKGEHLGQRLLNIEDLKQYVPRGGPVMFRERLQEQASECISVELSVESILARDSSEDENEFIIIDSI